MSLYLSAPRSPRLVPPQDRRGPGPKTSYPRGSKEVSLYSWQIPVSFQIVIFCAFRMPRPVRSGNGFQHFLRGIIAEWGPGEYICKEVFVLRETVREDLLRRLESDAG